MKRRLFHEYDDRKKRRHSTEFFQKHHPSNRTILSDGNLWPAKLRFSPATKVSTDTRAVLPPKKKETVSHNSKKFLQDSEWKSFPVVRSLQFDSIVASQLNIDAPKKRIPIDPPGLTFDTNPKGGVVQESCSETKKTNIYRNVF